MGAGVWFAKDEPTSAVRALTVLEPIGFEINDEVAVIIDDLIAAGCLVDVDVDEAGFALFIHAFETAAHRSPARTNNGRATCTSKLHARDYDRLMARVSLEDRLDGLSRSFAREVLRALREYTVEDLATFDRSARRQRPTVLEPAHPARRGRSVDARPSVVASEWAARYKLTPAQAAPLRRSNQLLR